MIDAFIRRVEAYARAKGVTPQWVARKATGNPYIWDRVQRRADELQKNIADVEGYMNKNPATEPDQKNDCTPATE